MDRFQPLDPSSSAQIKSEPYKPVRKYGHRINDERPGFKVLNINLEPSDARSTVCTPHPNRYPLGLIVTAHLRLKGQKAIFFPKYPATTAPSPSAGEATGAAQNRTPSCPKLDPITTKP